MFTRVAKKSSVVVAVLRSNSTSRTLRNFEIFSKYTSLPINRSFAEYVWIGGNKTDLRSKIKTLNSVPTTIEEFPLWNYDGSSTNQAPGHDSEVELRPVNFFKHPILPGNNFLVMCETFAGDKPIPSNTRHRANEVMEKTKHLRPMFAFEQEYSLWYNGTHLGFPEGGYPAPQGPYYCSVGAENAFGRQIAESHYYACLHAGINVSGINAEVLPGQWEFQVGPVVGIDAADQLWLARFLLHRVAEDFGAKVDFDPKPKTGDWNGAGMHTNFCIAPFHQEGGWELVEKAMKKLEAKHMDHIHVYGDGNERRLSGAHETSPINKFSWAVGSRGVSVRIPRQTFKKKAGYFEDRRPAANADPYLVSGRLMETIGDI